MFRGTPSERRHADSTHHPRPQKATACLLACLNECVRARTNATEMRPPAAHRYQTSYPRSERLRKRWLFKRLFELLLTGSLMVIILEQFLVRALTLPQPCQAVSRCC